MSWFLRDGLRWHLQQRQKVQWALVVGCLYQRYTQDAVVSCAHGLRRLVPLYNECIGGKGQGVVQDFTGGLFRVCLGAVLHGDAHLTTTCKPCIARRKDHIMCITWVTQSATLPAGFAQRLRGRRAAAAA